VAIFTENLRVFVDFSSKILYAGFVSPCQFWRKNFYFFSSAQVFTCALSTHTGYSAPTFTEVQGRKLARHSLWRRRVFSCAFFLIWTKLVVFPEKPCLPAAGG
jgi:hypothetical protein